MERAQLPELEKVPAASAGSPDDQPKILRSDSEKSVLDIEKVSYGDDDRRPASEAGATTIILPVFTAPWYYKYTALAFTILLPIGSNWATSAMQPLKATFRNELGMTNTQYGVVDAAGSVVNSLWPIIGGVALDWYGYASISIACTTIVLIGTVLTALAPTTDNWRMLIGGAIVQSFGIAVLDAAQHKLFFHWFGTSGLAFAFGIETAFSRTTQLVSGISTLPIRRTTGSTAWSLWVPVILSAFSLVSNVVFVFWEKKIVPAQYRLTSAKEATIARGLRRFSFQALFGLPWTFWVLPVTQLFQSESTSAFTASATDLITKKGYKEEVAAFTANARQILPIVLAPIVGLGVDRFGHRFHLIAAAPVLFVFAFVIMGWTTTNPIGAMILFSLGSVINYMPFQVTIPLIVRDQSKIGTAFGLWRSFSMSGASITEIVYGLVQDGTPETGIASDYSRILIIGLSFKVLAFFLGVGYIFMDRLYMGKACTMGEKARVARELEVEANPDDPLVARPTSRVFTIFSLSLFVAMMTTSWALFFRYSA